MKTFVLLAYGVLANALLPPGYEDEMWCPPDNCRFYTNPESGFVGPASSFYACENVDNGEITDGIWTGNLTNVTAPENWISPPECDAPSPSPTSPSSDGNELALLMKIPCTNDEECFTKIRSQAPDDTTGVEMCGCYADSISSPFDECEGSDTCRIAKCASDSCEGLEAYCAVDDVGGFCNVRKSVVTGPTGTATPAQVYTWDGRCSSDNDCYLKTRLSAPDSNAIIDVLPCQCYANSWIDPLDECQGDASCTVADCVEYPCNDTTAYCSVEEGICLLSTSDGDTEQTGSTASSISSVGPSVTMVTVTPVPIDFTWDGAHCSSDDVCYPKTRERVPGMSDTIGVGICECYANSYSDPFDECQGESDTTCPIAGCMENPCDGSIAYCIVEEGVCFLDSPIDNGTSPTSIASVGATVATSTNAPESVSYTWSGGICSSENDCYLKTRFSVPGNSAIIGVLPCQCYANSWVDPLDECQGDVVCPVADCAEYPCDDVTAYCSKDEGICLLSTSADFAEQNTTNTMATITAAPDTVAEIFTVSTAPASNETMANEITHDMQNETFSPSPTVSDKPVANETSELTSSAPITPIENVVNKTSEDNQNVTSATAPTAPDEIIINKTSENSQNETFTTIPDKIEEGLRTQNNSGVVTKSHSHTTSLIGSLFVVGWLMH